MNDLAIDEKGWERNSTMLQNLYSKIRTYFREQQTSVPINEVSLYIHIESGIPGISPITRRQHHLHQALRLMNKNVIKNESRANTIQIYT